MTEKKFFHAGIAVDNLDFAVSFFERIFGFELVQSRRIDNPYLWKLIGKQGTSAEVRMMAIDSDTFLEILEWTKPDTSHQPEYHRDLDITDVGAQHLCIYSEDAESLFQRLGAEPSVEFISAEVTEIASGPNKDAKVFFVKVFGFLFLEIFQKAPASSES